jgi:formate/nitrite transporter FocA (FNT family)
MTPTQVKSDPQRDGDDTKPTRHERGDTPEQERREARHRRQISAKVVHEAIRYEGEEELDRSTAALMWSGLAAGLTMGLSLAAQGMLRVASEGLIWQGIIEALGYTLGFVFVVAGRQQLFTENTLTPVLPVFHDWSRLGDLARLWGVVLLANLLGGLAFAWAAAVTPLFDATAQAAFVELAREATSPPTMVLFVRAIGAGWLIALMVWLLPAAEHARLAMIVLPTFLIGLAHLTHSIAGAVEASYLVFSGVATWLDYARFVSVAVAGNVIGGVVFVALINHRQAVAGDD